VKKIRIGIFGAGRGIDIACNMMHLGCEIVALCDFNEKRRNNGVERLGIDVAVFDNTNDITITNIQTDTNATIHLRRSENINNSCVFT
jgi:predicted homoserine dehydrogenase-like protein